MLIGTEDVESTANDIINVLLMDSVFKSTAGNFLNSSKINENIKTQIDSKKFDELVSKYPGFVTNLSNIEKVDYVNKTLKITFRNNIQRSWVSPRLDGDSGLEAFYTSLIEKIADQA